ncbi:MAG: helix-turn-helix transcriptional regulator [Flavobacterium sp.]
MMNLFIGNKLKALRNNKGWTQQKVSDQLLISQSAYARIESGESQSWVVLINKICEIFEISPEELFKKEEEVNVPDNLSDEIITQNALLNVYRKIIRRYEIQISELQKVIEDFKSKKDQ